MQEKGQQSIVPEVGVWDEQIQSTYGQCAYLLSTAEAGAWSKHRHLQQGEQVGTVVKQVPGKHLRLTYI